MNLPVTITQLIDEIAKLPGIGKKTAKRLAFSILIKPESEAITLGEAIINTRKTIRFCEKCFGLTDMEICQICADPRRIQEVICVVEDPRNVFTIENSNVFNGVYHVLQGAISPVQGITPDKLTIRELEVRIDASPIQELIISTNPTLEGEATAHYLMDLFKSKVGKVSRIARGMPTGGDLEFADSSTLSRAFEGRTEII